MSGLHRILTRLGRGPAADAAAAGLLAAAGLAEVLTASIGAGDDRTVSAIAVVAGTLPLAWRRSRPLVPLAAIVAALLGQAALDGFLVGETVTPLVVLAIALYSAGRYAEGRAGVAGAAAGVVLAAVARVVADPAVRSPGHVALTLVAVSFPAVVGRWVRGQALLQQRFAERTRRLARDRDREARAAAEEERMRIAGDLQRAIAGRLRDIAARADAVPDTLRAGDTAAARAALAHIAATARDALADVRRVLGILRRDGQAAPRTPSVTRPGTAAAPAYPEPPAAAADPPGDRRRGALRIGERAADRLAAGAVLAGLALELVLTVPAGDRVLAALTAVPVAAALLPRRRHPLAAGAALLAALAVQSTLLDLDEFPVLDIAAVVLATYAIGAYTGRRFAIAGLAGAVAGAAVHAAIFYPDGIVAALLGGVAAPWTVGRVVSGHRALTSQGRDEAVRAEHARTRDARAAVTAERMRVARELHDAVAHSISVIAIQAAGADGIAERDPERTIRCAELVAAIAREGLAELGRLVGPLDDPAAEAAPPSLAHVDALAARARDAGQPVELRVEGEPATLPGGVDLAAYRIVQEALTNASKHAAGARAEVVVRYARHAVEVEVADDGAAAAAARAGSATATGGGHGLIGIRERVALYGGTLDVGRRPTGGFRLRARLPIGGA